jgi:hypothetical protein
MTRDYTVLLFKPESLCGDASCQRDKTISTWVEADYPEEAFGKAQDEAVRNFNHDGPPEDFEVLAIYPGHIFDEFTP